MQLQSKEYHNQRILTTQQLTLVDMFRYEGNPLRHVMINDEPWFAAKDTCAILEINDVKQASERLDEDERGWYSIPTPGGIQQMLCINESGVYHLIFTSRKLEAQVFRRWVTHEVLPAIRKTGSYGNPLQGDSLMEVLQTPDNKEFNQMLTRMRRLRRAMLTPPKFPEPKALLAPRESKPLPTIREKIIQVFAKRPDGTLLTCYEICRLGGTQLRQAGTEQVRQELEVMIVDHLIEKEGIGKSAQYRRQVKA